MSTRYRKKSVVVDVVKWDGNNFDDVMDLSHSEWGLFVDRGNQIVIPTLGGDMRASVGSWIIRGPEGELYSVSEDIFPEIYELESECDRPD